mgnify:FL=1|tara:strand:- start:3876 stop:4604 length:729 start_codon:yes stop_codon:yes gene_type:complete
MNYYLIVGFGFGEIRTIATKLTEKLSAKYGEKTVLREQWGVLRAWRHNDEQNGINNFIMPAGLSGLARFGDRLAKNITDDTQHIVLHGPGVLLNYEKLSNILASNKTDSVDHVKLTVDSTVTTYLVKTTENSATMANRLQTQWDTTVGDMVHSGTGIVNPTAEQIQASKDAYYKWCTNYANTAATMFGDYDEEAWQPWGGWQDDLSPTSVGVGITDVNTFTRKDGTISKFTPHSHQIYWTTP